MEKGEHRVIISESYREKFDKDVVAFSGEDSFVYVRYMDKNVCYPNVGYYVVFECI